VHAADGSEKNADLKPSCLFMGKIGPEHVILESGELRLWQGNA